MASRFALWTPGAGFMSDGVTDSPYAERSRILVVA
jgi:hypothetical protein